MHEQSKPKTILNINICASALKEKKYFYYIEVWANDVATKEVVCRLLEKNENKDETGLVGFHDEASMLLMKKKISFQDVVDYFESNFKDEEKVKDHFYRSLAKELYYFFTLIFENKSKILQGYEVQITVRENQKVDAKELFYTPILDDVFRGLKISFKEMFEAMIKIDWADTLQIHFCDFFCRTFAFNGAKYHYVEEDRVIYINEYVKEDLRYPQISFGELYREVAQNKKEDE